MAEISHRERILLGYSPNSVANFPSRRASEVDFSDVFGGPPRHSSTHEFYKDGQDSFDSVDDEETERFRSPWLGFGEKPVFGDEVGTRRRYQSEDFFDDIFKGDQPSICSQSPRSMPRRDSFSSAPGSRIMSPSRPLSPMVEPFASPAKFSLPAPLANADFVASPPINQSLNSPSFSTSRFNQTFQNHDVLRADVRLSYRPSPLSYQNLVDGKELASTKKVDGSVDEPGFNTDSKGSEVPINNAQFHFSIYKWASKGVPSVMSLRKKSHSRLKERIRFERCSSMNERVKSDYLDSYQVDTLADRNDILSSSGVKDCEHHNNTIVRTKIEESQSFDDISPVVSNVVSYNSHQNSKEQACEDASSYDLEVPREFPVLSKRSSHVDISNGSPKSHGNTIKSYMRSVKDVFQEEENANEMTIPKKGGKETMVHKKGQPSFDDDVSNHKISKSKTSESLREGKGDFHKSEVTKKVKEFVKILNQESSSKAKKNVLGKSQSSRWDETSTFKEDNKVKSMPTEKHSKRQDSKAKESKTLPKALEVADGNSFLSEKQQFDVKIVGSVFGAPTTASANESSTYAWRDAIPHINATPDNGFMDRESRQEIDVVLEVEHEEETQGCERKILQWSKGKEGNIRALLSTLQYVVWPDSGWKPVPLVDIIEANAVKKAYQRALLCLHPDKLQQKGTAVHHQFIAEKVFGILQEAWDHFNSLGPL